MSYLQSRLGTSSRISIFAAVTLFLTVAAVQLVSNARASIDRTSFKLELGYIKPWSNYQANRAAYRLNPEVIA